MANDQTTTITIPQQYQTVSTYDRMRASLDGIALFSKQATYTVTETRGSANMTNKGQTFIIETARTEHGDYCFLQLWNDENGTVRIALPPVVVNAMMRQKEALAKRNRSRRAKAVMQERIAAGENPAAHLLAFRKGRKKVVSSQKESA